MALISQTPEWQKLIELSAEARNMNLRNEFKNDELRFKKFSLKFGSYLFDFSKNLINEEILNSLFKLAERADLKTKIENMIAGEKINNTENRAVLHTALRNRSDKPVYVDGKDVMPDVHEVLNQMSAFTKAVHAGELRGYTGKKLTNFVNIGIGGSDLGPAMVCEALTPFAIPGCNAYFVSNVDGTDISETLKDLDLEATLFIIASKTFTTQETLANANSAKAIFLEKTGADESAIAKHFVALSTNEKAVVEFGINPANMFKFWDWVGGRYSLWSAIGLSIALYVGFEHFENLLTGAYAMDETLRNKPFESNPPVIMALLGIWYASFMGFKTHAVIPYDQYLRRFPDFLQQLDMESSGKQVTKSGELIDYATGPVIWGTIGTNSQHSFFQLIHQGTQCIPVDFIACVNSHNPIGKHQNILLSNFFAQTEALMRGKTEEEVIGELKQAGLDEDAISKLAPHKVFPGNRPTNSFLINSLTPFSLGEFIALYEHKVFVQGAIWDLNSFDQWGVELGKQLASKILPELTGGENIHNHDSSTNGLIEYFRTVNA